MIIWGKKRTEKHLGVVAEFCPFCRSISACDLYQMSMVPHLYYLPLSGGKDLGFMASCQQCEIRFPVDAARYQTFSDHLPHHLEILIRDTHSDIRNRYAERLALEEKVRHRQPLQPEERKTLLIEPFEKIATMLEMRFGNSMPLDKETGISCLLTLVIPFSIFCLLTFFYRYLFRDILILIAVLAVLIGIAITVGFIFTTDRRYLKQTIYPILADSLQPLAPTETELDRILQSFRDHGLQLGKKLKAHEIIAAIKFNTEPERRSA